MMMKAMITSTAQPESFKQELLNGLHADLSTDVQK